MPTRIPIPFGAEGPVLPYEEPPEDWSGWRSERGFLEGLVDKAKRGFNTLFDTVVGETPEERMEFAMDSLATTNPAAVGATTLEYVGRNPVVRESLLRALGHQIDRLPAGSGQDILRELVKSHPRVMAAFQHAGGTFEMADEIGRMSGGRRDPGLRGLLAAGPRLTSDSFSGAPPFRPTREVPWNEKNLVPGLRGVYKNPIMYLQSDKGALRDESEWSKYGLPRQHVFSDLPSLGPATTAWHEGGHWAQLIGSEKLKARHDLFYLLRWMNEAEKAEARRVLKKLTATVERGAERVENNQLRKLIKTNPSLVEELIESGTFIPHKPLY